jgi:RNA polymerase sigma-70 factor, ECF subfamily
VEPKAGAAYRVEDVYAHHFVFVRRKLASFGVGSADIDDLCHDVFLIVHARLAEFEGRSTIRLWLRQICWHVATARRRRAYRRREVQTEHLPDFPSAEEESPLDKVEAWEQNEHLHAALAQLDAGRRDLFALRVIGGLSIDELAEIANCDPKTARKRLMTAERRLGTLLADAPPAGQWLTPEEQPWKRPPADPSQEIRSLGFEPEFKIIGVAPGLKVAVLGSAIISDWPGGPTMDALDMLDSCIKEALRWSRIRMGYFAIIEPSSEFPSFEARQKMSKMLKAFSDDCLAYGTVVQGRLGRVAAAIMTALGALSRVPFPMRFFSSVDDASRWMADRIAGSLGAPDAAELIEAAAYVRVLDPS